MSDRLPRRRSPDTADQRRGPVGVFDSGVGGLSVLAEIHRELPHEDVLYAADSGHAPYGEKPAAFIEARAHAIVGFLHEQGAKAIVVACNTATGVAVDALRARWAMPIIGIEPAIKPAVAATKSGVVGVLATSQTIASARFTRLIDRFSGGARVVPQACPGLVEQVEKGDLSSAETRALVGEYLRPLIAQGADTIVLGCTHYPYLAPVIRAVAGPDVEIVDPAAAVARELRRRLEQQDLMGPPGRDGEVRCWTSGTVDRMREILTHLGVVANDVQRLPV